MEYTTIGFLGIYRFDNGAAIRGAILVTDIDTKPLEFRVTTPIRPEKFQKILYGELLDEHVSVELVGAPLLKELQQKPDLILVRDSLFLRLNVKQKIPTVLLLKEDEPLFKRGTPTKQLDALNSGHPSVKIYTSDQFEPKLEEIAQRLQRIFLSRNLMKPFERLKMACADVHARKVGDR